MCPGVSGAEVRTHVFNWDVWRCKTEQGWSLREREERELMTGIERGGGAIAFGGVTI